MYFDLSFIKAAGVIPAALCNPPKNIGINLILKEFFFSSFFISL